MTLQLFAHPFSSYCQKVLIALYENDTPFEFRMLGPDQPENQAELRRLWPVGKFPVLRDGAQTVIEASTIIEHLQIGHPGPAPMIPADAAAAIEVRMLYTTVNGRQIRLSGATDDKGVTGTAGVVGAVVLLPVAGFFLTGTSAVIPAGSAITGFVQEDVPLSFAKAEPEPMLVTSPAATVAPAPTEQPAENPPGSQ